jgi:hypothetical protein
MGHQHLSTLPRTRSWQRVVALIGGGAPIDAVAAETSRAAESQMIDASNDPTVSHSFWLLTQLPTAARDDGEFAINLRKLGLLVAGRPSLFDIVTALSDALDRRLDNHGGRTDLGEMSQLSALESVSAVAGRQLNDLFEVTPEATQLAFSRLSTVDRFAALSRYFFARLLRRLINYFLSRELSQHVGINSRFRTVWEHREFEIALDQHCWETARILKEFSGQWFSKHTYLGGITEPTAGRFAHIAFEKLQSEIRRRRDAHD